MRGLAVRLVGVPVWTYCTSLIFFFIEKILPVQEVTEPPDTQNA